MKMLPMKLEPALHPMEEKGSLALEQILFISAIVILGAGVGLFYSNVGNYFKTYALSDVTSSVTGTTSGSGS